MPNFQQSQHNYFVSSGNFLADCARQKVMDANGGQLVTPAYDLSNTPSSTRKENSTCPNCGSNQESE